MSLPKEIAEKIIKGKEYITSIDTEPRILARAYLEFEKKHEYIHNKLLDDIEYQKSEITKLKEELNLGKSSLRCGQCGNIGMFHHGFAMADEIIKLKKSREWLRKQLSIFSKLEISTNVSYDTNIGKKAREALKADDEIMKEV